MLRISVTTIEQFRKYVEEEMGDKFGNKYLLVTEEKLLEDIQNTSVSTPKQSLGTAFHEVLEKPNETLERFRNEYGNSEYYMASSGQLFQYEMIQKCLKEIDREFPFEVKKTKIYDIDGEQIEVVAKVDQWQGLAVNEHKSKWTEIKYTNDEDDEKYKYHWEVFDWGEYYRSCQWKFYLPIFGAVSVNYKVFELAIDKTNDDNIELIDVHKFPFTEYDDMECYTTELLKRFVAYIHFRELEEYFQALKNRIN